MVNQREGYTARFSHCTMLLCWKDVHVTHTWLLSKLRLCGQEEWRKSLLEVCWRNCTLCAFCEVSNLPEQNFFLIKCEEIIWCGIWFYCFNSFYITRKLFTSFIVKRKLFQESALCSCIHFSKFVYFSRK